MRRVSVFSVIAMLSLRVVSGCAEDRLGYCETKIDCEHGTHDDFEICTAMLEHEREMAEECGCSELYEDWLDCSLEKGTCESDVWELGDSGVAWEEGPEWVTDESCMEIASAMHLCETDAGLDPDNGGECGG